MTEFDKDAGRHWDKCWPALQAFADAFNEQRRRHPTAPALPEVQPLLDIVAAKREAERPHLLTVGAAGDVYNKAYTDAPSVVVRHQWAIDAVLTEERKRTLKVIEALPSSVEQKDATGAYVLIPRPNDRDLRERHYKLSDIRSVFDRS